MTESPLYKKKISLNGDSICYGVAYLGGYGRIIAERNSMQYQNIGIAGGTICAETYVKTDGRPRYWISRNIQKMDSDADYAILEGGVNDASLFLDYGTPKLGEITHGYDSALDDTTFYGAFESMLKQLTKRFAGKKIGYIIVHKMAKCFTPEWEKDKNFYLAAIECCEKWGVPYLDLTKSVPPFAFFTKDGDPELYAL